MLKHALIFAVVGWALSALVRDLAPYVFVWGVFYFLYALYREVRGD